jgi:hypothetical protein
VGALQTQTMMNVNAKAALDQYSWIVTRADGEESATSAESVQSLTPARYTEILTHMSIFNTALADVTKDGYKNTNYDMTPLFEDFERLRSASKADLMGTKYAFLTIDDEGFNSRSKTVSKPSLGQDCKRHSNGYKSNRVCSSSFFHQVNELHEQKGQSKVEMYEKLLPNPIIDQHKRFGRATAVTDRGFTGKKQESALKARGLGELAIGSYVQQRGHPIMANSKIPQGTHLGGSDSTIIYGVNDNQFMGPAICSATTEDGNVIATAVRMPHKKESSQVLRFSGRIGTDPLGLNKKFHRRMRDKFVAVESTVLSGDLGAKTFGSDSKNKSTH